MVIVLAMSYKQKEGSGATSPCHLPYNNNGHAKMGILNFSQMSLDFYFFFFFLPFYFKIKKMSCWTMYVALVNILKLHACPTIFVQTHEPLVLVVHYYITSPPFSIFLGVNHLNFHVKVTCAQTYIPFFIKISNNYFLIFYFLKKT